LTHGKGQELAAAEELIQRLEGIEGTVMTFDALHANHERMEKVVVEKGADYLIQAKDNAPALATALERALHRKHACCRRAEDLDYGHGRIERRTLQMVPISPTDTGWPHTYLACRVDRDVEKLRRGQVVERSHEHSLYVASFPFNAHEPERVLALIRGHWGIENQLHHPKDRSMDEDRCRASESGIGRVVSCIRGLVAQISRRTKESLGVIRRRLASRQHLLIKLLSSTSLAEWERRCRPYKTA
jgi:predicted transposase YbfD/YdcC